MESSLHLLSNCIHFQRDTSVWIGNSWKVEIWCNNCLSSSKTFHQLPFSWNLLKSHGFSNKTLKFKKKRKKTSQKAQPTHPNLFESFCNFTTSERHPWPPTPPNFSDFATRRLHSLQAQPRDKILARWPRSRHDGVITWNFLGSCCSFEGFNQTSTFQPLKISGSQGPAKYSEKLASIYIYRFSQ